MIPHQPCRVCGVSDSLVRFGKQDLCEACRAWIARNGEETAHGRPMPKRYPKKHPEENNCPDCGGYKNVPAARCADCYYAAVTSRTQTCPECGGYKKTTSKTCRECYERRIESVVAAKPACRECGVGRDVRIFKREDLCNACWQRLRKANRLGPLPPEPQPEVRLEPRPDRREKIRTDDEAARVDPALAAFLSRRRARKAPRPARRAA